MKLAALVDASDFVGVIGFMAFEYGVAQWSHPAAWVTGGVVLVAVAISPTLRKGKGKR